MLAPGEYLSLAIHLVGINEICLPSVIVRGCGNTSAGKHSLTLDIHLLSGREYVAIGDHEILCNIGIRDNNNCLLYTSDAADEMD